MNLAHTAPIALLAGLALAAPAEASAVGTYLSDVKLEGLAQTKAKSFDDFSGRAVLVEFFAFW